MDFSLEELKKFAEENFAKDENDPNRVVVECDDVAVTNPWMDRSGRFVLTDEGAVREWGLATITAFAEKATLCMLLKALN